MRRTGRRQTPAAAAAAHPPGSSIPVMQARMILRIFGPFLRPQWPGCLLAALLAVAGTGIALLKPWPLKYLFDEVLLPSGNPTSQDIQYILVLVVVALAAITVLDSLVGAARSYIMTVVGERVAASIRTRLYDHLQRLPLAYHEGTPTGELTTRLTGDVDKVRALLTVTFVDASTHVLTLAGMAGATKALVFQLASLTDVYWSMSGEVVLMTLLGGMGTIFGPFVGAAVIVTMQNYFASFGAWVTVLQGTIFVVSVLLFREGIIGVLSRWLKKPL